MDTFGWDVAVSNEVVAGTAPFVVGVVIAAMLVAAVWWGMRVRAQEPGPPRPEEQPHLPDGGAVHEIREAREPEEMPHDGQVLTPYELHAVPTRRAKKQSRPVWNTNSSGGFGSGGLGHH
ncbi:DUF6479 family protein [Streptomyces albicerus]|jgi:hypothetical protein|uniref:DUF6479 family protein n=1 Tax=Streptomyces albicerus TaxID=2569859 RepID=UPI00124B300C|nr:DUF6479 family protein [Streptomyces albicerus]